VDQRGHGGRIDLAEDVAPRGPEDRRDVMLHGDIAVGAPDASELAARRVVGGIERSARDAHAGVGQNPLEIVHPSTLVAVVGGRVVEQERAPEIERDRADLQERARKRGGRLVRKGRGPSRGSSVAYAVANALMPDAIAVARSV